MPIIQPPAVLIEGPPGSGKTDVLATLLEAGLEVFVIVTEPDGIASLLDSCTRRKIPIDRLHWAFVEPAAAGWSALTDMAKTIGDQGFEQIQNVKSGADLIAKFGKADTRKPAMKLLSTLANFICERTDHPFGDVTLFDDSCALVIDSLSGINVIAWTLTVGYKPAAHMGEWGVAMNFVEQLLMKLTSTRSCFFVLTAHVERELSELEGVTKIMTSTLGRKLAPKIPRFFSEVVYAERALDLKTGKANFTWSTVANNVDLKSRSLPAASGLVPSFVPIVDAYRRRLATVTPAYVVPVGGVDLDTLAKSGPGTIVRTPTAPGPLIVPIAPMGRKP